jgi:hypothetical protein
MRRSEVYSWRVATEVKAALEEEARRDGEIVGTLLERIALEWLGARRRETDADDAQARLHALAAETFGTIAGAIPIDRRPCGPRSAAAWPRGVVVSGLIDTGAILALLDRDDRWHGPCVEAFATLRLPLLTSSAVWTELFHLVGDQRREADAAWAFPARAPSRWPRSATRTCRPCTR